MRQENRLLITNCFAGMGGGEIAILRHLDHSSLPPDQITVALLNDGPLVAAIRERGVRCELVGRPGRDGAFPGPLERVQIAWRLTRLVRRLGISCVVCYTVPDLMAASLARRLTQFRLCWRSQGEATIFHRAANQTEEIRRLVRIAARNVDRVATTTEWDRKVLESHNLSANRLRTIYLGVDDDWFGANANGGPPIGVRRIVMSGRLVPWKGHQTFLRAFAKIAGSFPDLEACIVGGGSDDYHKTLESEAEQLGVGGRTRFLGHVSDVRALLCTSHLAVHCSEREPFGLVLIEAMATGLPVVASDVEGPREILRHGQTGLLIAPQDVDGFAAAIAQIISNPDLGRQMGQAGRQVAVARFRDSINVPMMEDYFLG